MPAAPHIKYENLKMDFCKEFEKILNSFSVNTDKSDIGKAQDETSFKSMSGGRNPGEELNSAKARKGISGDWQNYFTSRDAEIFMDIAGDELLRYSYEKDSGWIDGLPPKLCLFRAK